MYTPTAFRIEDAAVIAAFMQQFDFAAIVTTSPAGLVASHLPAEAYEKMLGVIVGFEMRVERCEAKFKLGQNRSIADRAGAAAGLDAEQSAAASAVAELMRRHGGAIR
jgi:predicted FMN-binding regulatory protein PaiB